MCVALPLCRHYHYYFLSPDRTLPCTPGQNIRPHPRPRPRPRPQHHDHYHGHALHPYLKQQPAKPIIGEGGRDREGERVEEKESENVRIFRKVRM